MTFPGTPYPADQIDQLVVPASTSRQSDAQGTTSTAERAVEVGLYVHVAFCRTKCFYCDFNAYAGLDHLIDDYVRALAAEITCLPPALPGVGRLGAIPFRIGSVFFGGGTPSLVSGDQVKAVLNAAATWPTVAGGEVSLEANPCDLSLAYLQEIREAGVNRLSLGVQSFDDAMLRRLGRRHDVAMARNAFAQARAAGFDNVSIDLMFGLPGQTLSHWQTTLEHALALQPDHLSLYNLTIEPDTPFGTWAAAGKLVVPDDDAAADMYQAAIDRLGDAGYDQYEISNWSRRDLHRDFRAQHNLRYWRNLPYFGVGAGAHSSFGGFRYANVCAPLGYVARARADESVVEECERINPELEMGETMMLGLRLAEGIDVSRFQQRFGCSPRDVYGSTLIELEGLGLLALDDGRIRLTMRGRFLGNEVFCRFLPEMSN